MQITRELKVVQSDSVLLQDMLREMQPGEYVQEQDVVLQLAGTLELMQVWSLTVELDLMFGLHGLFSVLFR